MSQAQLIAVIHRLEAALGKPTGSTPTVISGSPLPSPAFNMSPAACNDATPYPQPGAAPISELGCIPDLVTEHIPDLIWVSQHNPARLIWSSAACSRLLGVSPEQLPAELRNWRNLVHQDDILLLDRTLFQHAPGETGEVEFRFIRPDGELRWLRVRTFIAPESVLIDGQPVIFGVAEDITIRHEQEVLRLALVRQQRMDLIREVHHRIKNNLQGVAGLLRQHADLSPELLPMIDQAITQVQAIAVIHGLQGQTPDAKVVLCELIPAIARSVETLFAPRVTLTVQTEIPQRICIKEQEAVPLALVLNELIMNSAKHARHAGAVAPIHIHLKWECRDNLASISISNPGHLPEQFDFEQSSGIGLSLVRSLLPPQGSTLSYTNANDQVTAQLHLRPPCIHLDKLTLHNRKN